MTVAAVIDEADLGIESFKFRVREIELNRRQDALAVLAHRLRQLHEGRYATSAGPTQPPLEVRGCVLRAP